MQQYTPTCSEQRIINDINDDLDKVLALIATHSHRIQDEAERDSITNDAVKRSMIFALVRLSAVSAVHVLAEKRVAKREKVKNKPTEQRDVRDVESSEETGDYTDCESNPAPTQTFL